MESQKLYCYVDETGQDTAGDFFLVSVIIIGNDRDNLRRILLKIENESGKGIKKWTKATRKQRRLYMDKIISNEIFKDLIRFSHYSHYRSYVDLTILSTAKSILDTANNEYQATVYVDGLRHGERRAFTAGLRKLNVRVRQVRGLTDQADEFIRLADSIAGFVRDALESDKEILALYKRAKRHNIIKEI